MKNGPHSIPWSPDVRAAGRDHAADVAQLKRWIAGRLAWLDANFAAPCP